MSLLQAGRLGVSICLDDIVHGATQPQHDARLQQVFHSLSAHHIILNTVKCLLGIPEIKVVGYKLSGQGITSISLHVDAIHTLLESQSFSQLASSLGMATYYLRFLPQSASTVAPLRHLGSGPRVAVILCRRLSISSLLSPH